MNPRFRPSSEYLPALTFSNENLPSADVMNDSGSLRDFKFLSRMRARSSGCPSILLTAIPEIRKPAVVGRASVFCAVAIVSEQQAVMARIDRVVQEPFDIAYFSAESLSVIKGTCTVSFWPAERWTNAPLFS